jgi:hypothetical protein
VPLSPADVGRRVVVRRKLGVEEGRPIYGDVLGVLESWTGGMLTIRRRDGRLVQVAEDDVVAGKPVPPPPEPRPRRVVPPGEAPPEQAGGAADSPGS